jgi:hypothetical protein
MGMPEFKDPEYDRRLAEYKRLKEERKRREQQEVDA